MHVGLVSLYDPTDIRHWSGLAYHFREALTAQGVDVTSIGNLREPFALDLKAKQLYYRMKGVQHWRNKEPRVLKHYARQAEARIASVRPDVVLGAGTLPLAHLKTDRPLALWSGSTFASVHQYYPEYTRLSAESIRNGHRMEQHVLDRTDLAIYACDWAAQTAVDFYGFDPDRVHVVPYGANFVTGYTAQDVDALVANRPTDRCRLLFVGVDWWRKGGDLTLLTAERLNARGIPTELTVVGAQPEFHRPLPDWVHVEGFIDKQQPSGRARLKQLFAEHHFMMMPSRAESFGVVYSEAAASALPSIASDAGGIPTIFRNGVNGQMFAREAPIQAYADWIEATFTDQERYRDLCRSTFNEYETRLNWDVAGKRVKALLETLR